MSQILKMVDGGNAKSKKQQELDQIAANRKKIQDAYDSGALSELAKANLDMISQNAQSYLAADPLKNKNARKFQLELTNRMADIVDGKEGYSPFNTEIADKNIFGYYSSPEMGIIANELVRQTLNGKTGTQQTVGSANPTQTSGGSSVAENMHHTYDWLGGTNLDLLPASATTKDKVNAVVAGLKKGIADVKTAHAAGKTIHGFDISKLEAAKARLDRLSILDTDDDNTAFNKLIKEVLDGTFAIPQDVFKSLFSKYYGGSSGDSIGSERLATLKANHYSDDLSSVDLNLKNYASSKGWNLLTSDGDIYAYDKQYNPLTQRGYIQDDFTKPNYGYGIFVDNSGKIHYGPLTGENAIDRADIGELYDNVLAQFGESNRDRYSTYHYDRSVDKLDILDGIYSGVDSSNLTDVDKNALKLLLNKEDVLFADLSYYFDGNDIVLGITNSNEVKSLNEGKNPQGINWNDHFIVKYNPDTKLYVFGKFSPDGYKHSGADNYRSKEQLYDQGQIFTVGDFDVETYSFEDLAQLEGKEIDGSTPWYTPDHKVKDPQTMINFALKHWNDQSDYCKNFFDKIFPEEKGGKLKLAISIWKLYRNGSIELNDALIRKLMNIINSARPVSHKNGGILFAKQGAFAYNTKIDKSFELETAKSLEKLAKAESQGRSVNLMEAGESTELSSSDWARIATTIADLTTIGTAFIPVYGTAIAGATSLGTTAIDLGIDIVDPSISAGQVVKNLAVNAGLSAASIIPGLGGFKALKSIKGLGKLMGKLIPLATTAGLLSDENVRKSFKKVGSDEKLTSDDIKNITYVLKGIAGASRVGVSQVKARQLRVRAGKETGNLKFTTKNGKDVTLSVDQLKQIHEEGIKNGNKGAIAKFRELAGKDFAKDELTDLNYGVGKNRNIVNSTLQRLKTKERDLINRGEKETVFSNYDRDLQDFFNYTNANRSTVNSYNRRFNLGELRKFVESLNSETPYVPQHMNPAWWNLYGKLRTDYEIANGINGSVSPFRESIFNFDIDFPLFKNPRSTYVSARKPVQITTSTSGKTSNQAPKQTPKKSKTTKKSEGGKLDRLHNYINKK